MLDYYEQLKALSDEAEEIRKMGASGRYIDDAMEGYKAFKEKLPLLQRQSEKQWKGQLAPWFVNAYQSGLRKAHIELRCPTNTSPSNPRWSACISYARSALDDEIKKISDAIQKGQA